MRVGDSDAADDAKGDPARGEALWTTSLVGPDDAWAYVSRLTLVSMTQRHTHLVPIL